MDLPFEFQVLIQRIVMPSLLGLAGGILLLRCERPSFSKGENPIRGVAIASIFGSILVGAALIVSDFWQRELIANPLSWRRWEAREPWMWMVWLIPGLILGLGIFKSLVAIPSRIATWFLPWLVVGAVGCFYIALPQGQSYRDQLPNAIRFLAIGIAATALNSVSLNAIASHPGGRWATLTLLAQLGCIAGLAFQSYASLGEFILAGFGVTLGLSLVSLFHSSEHTTDYGWPLAPAVLGLTVLAAVSLAVSTFYVTTPPPTWLWTSILFLPTIIAGIDWFLVEKHWGWRLAMAAIIWALILSTVVAMAMQSKSDW